MLTIFIFGTAFGIALSYYIGNIKAKKADKKLKANVTSDNNDIKEDEDNGDISTAI